MNNKNNEPNNQKITGSTPWDLLRNPFYLILFICFLFSIVMISHVNTKPGNYVKVFGISVYPKPDDAFEPNAQLTRDNMHLRKVPYDEDEDHDKIICQLDEGDKIEIIEKIDGHTEVKAKCPLNNKLREGFLANYEGERPFDED